MLLNLSLMFVANQNRFYITREISWANRCQFYMNLMPIVIFLCLSSQLSVSLVYVHVYWCQQSFFPSSFYMHATYTSLHSLGFCSQWKLLSSMLPACNRGEATRLQWKVLPLRQREGWRQKAFIISCHCYCLVVPPQLMPDLWQWSKEGWEDSCCASIELTVWGERLPVAPWRIS